MNESNKAATVKADGAVEQAQTNGAGQQGSDSVDSDEFQEFESYQQQNDDVNNHDDVSAGSSTENRNNEGIQYSKTCFVRPLVFSTGNGRKKKGKIGIQSKEFHIGLTS